MGWKIKLSKSDIGIGIAVIVAIGIGIYNQYDRKQLLALPQRYVIGEIVKERYPASRGRVIEYTYIINNKEYKGETNGSFGGKVGERYFVSVPIIRNDRGYVSDESQGIILLDQQVPDSIKSPPLGGWMELPVKTDQ